MLEEAESALTGRISIEDVTVQNDGAPDTVLRRMVFTSNRNLVQSEAVLRSSTENGQTTEASPATEASERSTDAAVPGTSTNGKLGKAKGKAAKQKANSGSEGPSAATHGTQALSVHHSHLACDYHKGIIAGLSLIQPHLVTLARIAQQDSQQTSQQSNGQPYQHDRQSEKPQDVLGQSQEGPSSRPQAMVVGLGGGGLPVFLNKHCGMDVQSVELDPVVVDLARRHFGFADSANLQVNLHFDELTALFLLFSCCIVRHAVWCALRPSWMHFCGARLPPACQKLKHAVSAMCTTLLWLPENSNAACTRHGT